jgi:hypothetical protein
MIAHSRANISLRMASGVAHHRDGGTVEGVLRPAPHARPRLRAFAAALLVAIALVPSIGAQPAAAAGCTLSTTLSIIVTVDIGGNGTGDVNIAKHGLAPVLTCHRQGGITAPTPCRYGFKVTLSQTITVDIGLVPNADSNVCHLDTSPDPDLLICSQNSQAYQETFDKSATDSSSTFSLLSPSSLDITVVGPGSVTSAPIGINCPGKCSADYAINTTVVLTTHTSSSTFVGWSGICTGTGTCTVTPSFQAHFLGTATFAALVTAPPSLAPTQPPTRTAPPTRSPTPAATPGSTAVASAQPTDSATPSDAIPSATPALSSGPSPGPSDPAATTGPTAATTSDLTPVAVAIVIAALVLGGAIAFAAMRLRRPAG